MVCQEIEQFRMRRGLAEDAEVVDRRDDAAAEQMMPHAIDVNARDERRDAFLRARGFAVLRIPAVYVLQDLGGAIGGIVAACDARSPLHHRPLADGPPPRNGEV